MAARFLGYLTDHHLALYKTDREGWQLVREFDEPEAEKIVELLDRDHPVHLLADVVEMEFRLEKVTFLRGGDRRALHERKLLQAFRSSPFRHAFPLGREPGRRGQEKLLLSAITNPELVTPWLAPLRERHLPMSGIASVPLLHNLLARQLRVANPHLMLLTVQRRGGIRISYFRDKEMSFSRLAVHPGEIATLAGIAHEEVVRTHQYLMSLRLVDRNNAIDVACLLPEDTVTTWQAAQPSTGSLRFHHVSLGDMAGQVGIKERHTIQSADDLSIALLLRARFPNHFAAVTDRHDHHIFWLRRSLIGLSGIATVAAATASASLLYGAVNHQLSTDQANASTQALNTEIQQVRDKLPKTNVPVDEIKEAISLTQSLQRESAPSRRLLADISQGFDAVPQADLNSLAWISSEHPEQVTGDDIFASQAESSPTAQGSHIQDPGAGKRWVALLNGDIVGASSYRKANALADDVANAIRRQLADVEIIQYPFNVRSDVELKDDLNMGIPERLPFRMRVIWKK